MEVYENSTNLRQRIGQNDEIPFRGRRPEPAVRRRTGGPGSRRGASIALALLLFFACTVIGLVLVIAGTAVAGSFSGREELDRRYYCVTSAVELLRRRYDGHRVRFTIHEWQTPVVDELTGDVIDTQYNRTIRTVPDDGERVRQIASFADAGGDFLKLQSLRVLRELNDPDWDSYIQRKDENKDGRAPEEDRSGLLDEALRLLPDESEPIIITAAADTGSGTEPLPGLRARVRLAYSALRGMRFEVSNYNIDDEDTGSGGEGVLLFRDAYQSALYSSDRSYVYTLKMDFTADVLKETELTEDGRNILFTVNWELRGVSG